MQDKEDRRTEEQREADGWRKLYAVAAATLARHGVYGHVLEEMVQTAVCFAWGAAKKRADLTAGQCLKYAIAKALAGCLFATHPKNRALCVLRRKLRFGAQDYDGDKGGLDYLIFRLNRDGSVGMGEELDDHHGSKDEPEFPSTRDPAPALCHKQDLEAWEATLDPFDLRVLRMKCEGYLLREIADTLAVPFFRVECASRRIRESIPPALLCRPCKGNGGGR